jgi:pimeloyl-ACP methyl ester carboxylesterase
VAPEVSRVALATGLHYELLSMPARDPACDRTLLFLHGFLDSAWGWLPVLETGLFADYHVLVPSLRGHGDSDWIGAGGAYYFFDYAADLESLLATHARGRISLAGHSMGGMVAVQLAAAFGERIERVALLEGISVPEMPTTPERLRESVLGRAAALRRRGTRDNPGTRHYASLAEAAQRMRHHDRLLDEAMALRLAERACLRTPSGEWVFRHDPLHATRSPVGFELAIARRFFAAIRTEVLYVEGEHSSFRLVGDDRRQRFAAFEQARSLTEHTILGAGHMMLRHAPGETARALATFFGRGA